MCTAPAQCDDGDRCTNDACSDGQCTHADLLGIDAVICRLATLRDAVHQSIAPVHGMVARNLFRRTKRMYNKAVRAKSAGGRRAHRLLRRLDRQLGRFTNAVRRLVAQGFVDEFGGGHFVDLATGAKDKLQPLLTP